MHEDLDVPRECKDNFFSNLANWILSEIKTHLVCLALVKSTKCCVAYVCVETAIVYSAEPVSRVEIDIFRLLV